MVAQSRTNVGIAFQADARARLMASPWLRECSAEFCAALLEQAIIRHSPAGARLFHAGDEGGGLFGIATGTVEISLYLSHPDTPIIHLSHGGYWAGYRPLVGRLRGVGVVARSDVVWALVPRHVAHDLLAANPEWWRFIARLADDNAEIALGAIADLTRQDSRLRAIAVLLRLAGCRHRDPPDGQPIELRLSQTELAAMAVMSRNTLNSIMRELVEARLVAGGYRTLLIRNPTALRAILAAAE
jgi:CRP-like cAMP-binding protein